MTDRRTQEARLRGDRRIGTGHLLLGVFNEADSVATRSLGIALEDARTAFDALDSSSLAAIGVDVEKVERSASHKRTLVTSGARSVLPRAVAEVCKGRSRRIGPEHLLLALLDCERPDPAAELMGELGMDQAAARERLQHM